MAVKIRVKRGGRIAEPIFLDLRQRLQTPFGGSVGAAIAEAMRFGEGSVEQQFQSGSTIGNTGGRQPWKRSDFGFGRPLHRSGRLMSAWLGFGAGSVTEVTAGRVRIGVDGSIPYARTFQNRGAFIGGYRSSPAKRRAMRLAIGLKHGIWITQEKIDYGLRIEPRPVSINPMILDRVKDIALGRIVSGDEPLARRAA